RGRQGISSRIKRLENEKYSSLMQINLQYTEPQAKYLFDHDPKVRFVIVPAGRRFGKTKGAANACMEWVMEGKTVLWVDTIAGNVDRYVDRYFKPELKKAGIPYSYSTIKKVFSIEGFSGYIDFRSADRPENIEG